MLFITLLFIAFSDDMASEATYNMWQGEVKVAGAEHTKLADKVPCTKRGKNTDIERKRTNVKNAIQNLSRCNSLKNAYGGDEFSHPL